MPKASHIIPALNAGQLSPLLEGRVDFAKYPRGLKICNNFIPTPQGPLMKRPGTKYVASSKDSTKKSRLIPFEVATDAAFILEFSDQRIRFYKNEQIITATAQNITAITRANPAVVTYSGSDTYANGDRIIITGVVGMTEVNNREFTVANVNAGANTLELSGVNSSSFTAYSSAGTVAEIIEIASPYTEAQLFNLNYAQSLDVLYIAHPSHAPRKLSRLSDTSWTLAEIEFKDGPYQASNGLSYKTLSPGGGGTTIGATFTMSAGTAETVTGCADNGSGLVRVTISGVHEFQTGDRIFVNGVTGTTEANGTFAVTRISTTQFDLQGSAFANAYIGGGTATPALFEGAEVGQTITQTASAVRGFGVITAIASHVSATVETKQVFNGGVSADWAFGLWSDSMGYPAAVSFFGDRLYWGGGAIDKQKVVGSVVGDYENMAPRTAANLIVDDGGVAFSLSSNTAQSIKWMMDDEKGLLIGTQGGEWILRATINGEAITPSNVKADQSTALGSNDATPIKTTKAIMFVQRAGKKVRELSYGFEADGFNAVDVTIASENITGTGVVQMAFQAQPCPILWIVRSDGILAGLSYDRENELLAWHQHTLGGSSVSVESAAVIPNPDQDGDQLWLMVKRTINGATVRTIEYMDKFWFLTPSKEDSHFVDCGSAYIGSATTSVTGLTWLPGENVTILANGASHANKTVSTGGAITTDVAVTNAHIGFGYTADAWTERLEAGAADGTAQGKFKRIHQVVFRFMATLGIKVGPDVNTLDTLTFRNGTSVLGSSPSLFTGDHEVKWNGGTDRDARIYVQSYQPFPAIIVAIMPDVVTNDRG